MCVCVCVCVCVCRCVFVCVVVVGVENVLNLNKEVNTDRKHTSQHEDANPHVWCEAIQMSEGENSAGAQAS